jgi:hypothetical protein
MSPAGPGDTGLRRQTEWETAALYVLPWPAPQRDAWPRRRYFPQQGTADDLAAEADESELTIYRWLRHAGIPLHHQRRTRSAAGAPRRHRRPDPAPATDAGQRCDVIPLHQPRPRR